MNEHEIKPILAATRKKEFQLISSPSSTSSSRFPSRASSEA
jgi:hypothetical protein